MAIGEVPVEVKALYDHAAEVRKEIDRKFLADDVEDDYELYEAAGNYALRYVGDFEWMLKMRHTAASKGELSFAQAAGTLNCLVAELNRKPQPAKGPVQWTGKPAAAKPAEVTRAVPDATYTVQFADGQYRTLRLTKCTYADKPKGTQIASYLSGPDNTADYRGFAFVEGDQVTVWNAFKADTMLATALAVLVNASADAQQAYGKAFAMQSKRCYRCFHELTTPRSLELGVGPECASYVGIAY